MEENIAILMADLSGYTALTDTHGAAAAANLIDQFMVLVQQSLETGCLFRERTGDEVMIVSSSPASLLRTAIKLMKAATAEENFLQLHGGLHYGSVLKRNNSYFGTTINLTARIAAKADPGSFWCSAEFIDALGASAPVDLVSKGKQSFKNLPGSRELSQVMHAPAGTYVIDPVCRMLILDKNKSVKTGGHSPHYFCSAACRDIFLHQNNADPVSNHLHHHHRHSYAVN